MNRVDLKVVMLGHEAVGKTSLLERFVNDRFNEHLSYQNTIGAAFAAKQMEVGDRKFILGIWDTAGSERYEAMVKMYYRGAKAAIVCYDVTNLHSWNKAKFWMRELRSIEQDCKVYLCATKKDVLSEDKQACPDIEVIQKFADGIQAKFYVTSSKTGENIAELFQEIAQDFVSNPKNIKKLEEESFELSTESRKSRCCSLL